MSLNKVILIGRLGRDPEVRYMPNGEAVCNFSVATSETWNDRNGQRVERTEWHNITMYRKLAEIAGQYLKKGGLVYLEGRIQSRKYQGKDGIERTAYDIVANEMKMLGGRNENSGGAPYEEGYGQSQEAYQRPAQQSRQPASDAPSHPQEAPAAPRRQPVPAAAPVEDIDDDIPF
ncbi:TPA: single-stranded DNA-binding protein [Neisseria meningitidis]|jgi:single-strand binding protein|uniref:Single-stranded DNA-binding protein n=14 Tax=Neisseria meningitidis TaxID=487 RepID=SSB_NEIMB|nr:MULTISPECIES: single-stranded DNA-binding protein [Neisseria]P66848.1 RecName: Full=Single-stranded DNA-binding protein; Short=SSB [Neisseria meningitidis Z2491]P66849.1 RecName: Full=Single-stranded DNA-binding protein; Short=SSB [Neisseria meningitidis MC58]EGC53306.1 single-strand binding protein [Neisseria meningitidis OX99.30304]EGC65051.1 single-strand binding protein [Neisseria meningitidis 961-5945]ELL13842.1 single-stranded DNA-binding family protein [Neisseria meningitidis 61103]